MSRRGKHVTTAAQGEVEKPTESQAIVRALKPRGSNIFEVEYPDGHTTLVLLPSRFQKKLWVKNGGYLIIDKAEEAEVEGSKITGTIAAVLYAGHIKQLKREPGVWPAEFDNSSQCRPSSPGAEHRTDGAGELAGESSGSEDNLPPLEQNNNRRVIHYPDSDDSD